MLGELKKKDFWKAVIRLAIIFSLTATAAMSLFYFAILSFEDFKAYLKTENAIRKLLFILAFSPVYGLLVSLFYRTIKKM
jgi:hypothetical protein